MATNFYWPIYKNLEKEVIELSNFIHLDDRQLSIYSVRISDLLIRCVIEIESISKDLFERIAGSIPTGKTRKDLYFDTDCIDLLEQKWCLSQKKVIVAAPNFYLSKQDNKILTPLKKANKRGSSSSDWSKAYQAVKHDRLKDLKKGNIKHFIRALAALFILNIYYKDVEYKLGNDSKATSFTTGLGSEIFSIKLHHCSNYNTGQAYHKAADFDECVYLVDIDLESKQKVAEVVRKENRLKLDFLTRHPRFHEWLKHNSIESYEGDNLYFEILGKDIYIQMEREILAQTQDEKMKALRSIQYHAVLNNGSK
ncbi:MAG: hypothetical protein ACFB9N_07995 [Geitlerinemataceae cyanobacterium]